MADGDGTNSQDRADWFSSLEVGGDFTAPTLDRYFAKIQTWLGEDMAFLRAPIRRWKKKSDRLRMFAFVTLALGVLLPLPILNSWRGWPDGLELGYLAVLAGGLALLLDRVFNVSNSWMRLTLAEMQVRQLRYRLDLDWAKRRPLLSPESAGTEGPALIDMLRTAMDSDHQIMETQKKTWTSELAQAMEAMRARLESDRVSLAQLRAERAARPSAGGVTIRIDKPNELVGPVKVSVGSMPAETVDIVPSEWTVVNVPAGLTRVVIEAKRAGAAGAPYKAAQPVHVTNAQVEKVVFAV